jgi:ech hydrogenase subunit D
MTERKDLIQDIESAAAQDLLALTQDAKSAGYRLGQICATMHGEELEILYTFEKDNILKNYKTAVCAKEPELQSITAIYPYAFIYENEMRDLFGIVFKNLALDYGGKFFKTAGEAPWNPVYGKEGEN